MIENGVDVKTVQTCLGPSDAATTMSCYLHTFQSAQAAAMDTVANVIQVSTRQTTVQKDAATSAEVRAGSSDADASVVYNGAAITIGGSVSGISGLYGAATSSDEYLTEYIGSSATLVFYTKGGKVTGLFMSVNY